MHLSIIVCLNQCGAAMELHGYRPEPIMLELIRPAQLAHYQRTLGSPMRYAVMGQVALMLAKAMFPELPVSLREG